MQHTIQIVSTSFLRIIVILMLIYPLFFSCKEEKKPIHDEASGNTKNTQNSDASNPEQSGQTDNDEFANGNSTDSTDQTSSFLKTDIKATIRGEGKTIVFTYDDERRALKIQTTQAPSDTFMDENGYMYSYNSRQGWVKINLSRMMNKLPMMSAFAGSGFEGMAGTNNSNFFFPIVEWAMRFQIEAFDRNPNFKKQEYDCGLSKPCSKFIGIEGQELGSQAIFDSKGRLKAINFKGNTVDYEYGDYDVQLPNAKELSMGI